MQTVMILINSPPGIATHLNNHNNRDFCLPNRFQVGAIDLMIGWRHSTVEHVQREMLMTLLWHRTDREPVAQRISKHLNNNWAARGKIEYLRLMWRFSWRHHMSRKPSFCTQESSKLTAFQFPKDFNSNWQFFFFFFFFFLTLLTISEISGSSFFSSDCRDKMLMIIHVDAITVDWHTVWRAPITNRYGRHFSISFFFPFQLLVLNPIQFSYYSSYLIIFQ